MAKLGTTENRIVGRKGGGGAAVSESILTDFTTLIDIDVKCASRNRRFFKLSSLDKILSQFYPSPIVIKFLPNSHH
jgi:hypothetical protein